MHDKNITYKNAKQYAERKRRIREVRRIRCILSLFVLAALSMAVYFLHTFTPKQTISPQQDISAAGQNTSAKTPDEEPDIPGDKSDEIPAAKITAAPANKVIETPAADWNLILVNGQNQIPAGYSVTLTDIPHGQSIDSRAYADLQQMLDACSAEGLSPRICSSYRSPERQQELFDNKVARLMDEGSTYSEALETARTVVAVPGFSEHQTGLALDIVDETHQLLDETQESTAVQQWLLANSWEYGFVLRYPNGKSDITGIIYEPWHYRYVGKDAAKEMHELDLCLEEYLSYKNDNTTKAGIP